MICLPGGKLDELDKRASNFEQDGHTKQPYVPYESVEIEVKVEAPAADDSGRALVPG